MDAAQQEPLTSVGHKAQYLTLEQCRRVVAHARQRALLIEAGVVEKDISDHCVGMVMQWIGESRFAYVLDEKRPTYAELYAIIQTTLSHFYQPSELTDVRYYTPEQWRARGEPYNQNALLNMTFEGALNHALNNYVDSGAAGALNTALAAVGCYYELGYAWSLGVYLINP